MGLKGGARPRGGMIRLRLDYPGTNMPGSTMRICCALMMAICATPAAFAAECSTIESLQWMIGSWRAEVEPTLFLENWELAEDGAMRGYAQSKSTESGEEFMHEKLRIEDRSGTLFYVADASTRREPIAFGLARCGDDFVIFENPENDFPQKIAYTLEGPDAIVAHLTDLDNKGFELHFQRAEGSP